MLFIMILGFCLININFKVNRKYFGISFKCVLVGFCGDV